jgi:hypothetical protein
MLSDNIIDNSILFIIEMNNDTNTVEGIGLIRNNTGILKRLNIHSDGKFNRYSYTSKYRVDNEYLKTNNIKLLLFLETILFKNKTHVKRGCGIQRVPIKLLSLYDMNVVYSICNIFNNVYNSIINILIFRDNNNLKLRCIPNDCLLSIYTKKQNELIKLLII